MKTDLELKRDVESELRWEPSVQAERIGVSACEGVIELDGEVRSYAEKLAAEAAALRVADVRAVASDIKVVVSTLDSRTDEDIARAAMNHLDWNPDVPGGIKVKVTEGWITLSGAAEWQYQREAAADSVRYLTGVTGVTNAIEIKPALSTALVKDKIEDALKRNAVLEAARIQVATAGSEVTLRGSVGTWAERSEAERAAWSAPGVTGVHDLIAVE